MKLFFIILILGAILLCVLGIVSALEHEAYKADHMTDGVDDDSIQY